MAPNSPQLRQTPTLAPSPTIAQGTHSRSPPSHPQRTPSTSRPTPAEAYANQHHPRRDKDHPPTAKAKPLFEWITRKLGAGRRATYSDGTGPRAKAQPQGLSTQIFGPTTTRDSTIARSESHSLRSYSMSYANSVERQLRREANNPYPSIPVPSFHRDDAISESHFSRSRTPSFRSEISRPRLSIMDDESRFGGADEDASIRPCPPSHPSSPTPSQSLSRTVSASLLSPAPRPSTYRTMSSSSGSSDPGGRTSRQDSTSTKPTTILSFDSGPHPAHIAQAPISAPLPPSSPISPLRQPASVPTTAIPVDAQTPTTPAPFPLTSSTSLPFAQAPKHTQPHPRDNPNPSSTPEPNASTLTLASSNFAAITPISAPPAAARLRDITAGPSSYARPPSLATSPSVTFAPDIDRPISTYEYAPSVYAVSAHVGNPSIRTGRGIAADRDASVRAVRRKGSWESNESGWSWKGQLYAPQAAGQGLLNPLGNRLSAYGDEDGYTRDSFVTAQSRLSRGSKGWADEEPIEGRFEAATPIAA